ncbi:MAG TPA: GMC family oxidoreductase [Steroidobacteraceae bacterium]|nr:GMC family oxidoreductase [Steroidobacteraceae bacterium]
MISDKIYDLCIVGAGLAGGLLAAQATRKGHSVALLEAGSRFPFGNRVGQLLHHQTLAGPRWPWLNEARDHYVDSSAASIGVGYALNSNRVKGVGGSTLHWDGRINRLMPVDFAAATTNGLGVDWPITYAELEPWYSQADWELGVSGTWHRAMPPRSRDFPMEGFPMSVDDRLWEPIAERLGIEVFATPWAINSRPFGGYSQCLAFAACQICPSGARYSAERHIAIAEGTGRCELAPETVARRIDLGPSGKVKAVHATRLTGEQVEVRARVYVIAAHAVESARLLLLSRVGNHSDQVGRNLMEHVYVDAGGFLPSRRFYPGRVGYEVTESLSYYRAEEKGRRGGIKLEFTFDEDPLHESESRHLWGSRLAQYDRERFGHWIGLEAETEVQPNPDSRVTLDGTQKDLFGDAVPNIRFAFSPVDARTQKEAGEILANLLHEVGATEVSQEPLGATSWGAHHMGTCRMSVDPDKGVVDRDCRVHGTSNLYVAGSSVFPTSGALQPSLTIAALSLRLAEHLQQVLSSPQAA